MPAWTKHISSRFDGALYDLRNDILMMSTLTDRMFQNAITGLLERNTELCDQVEADDEEVDILEKQIDQKGVELLIRFHPVASDMREVVSAMKIGGHLEQIADECVTIVRRAKKLNFDAVLRELALVERPRSLASGIFRDSIRAFAEGDCELARTLKFKDRELDDAIDEVIERLSARASFGSDAARSCLDLIFIARALERIGDNATSIAEDSFWRDEGDDIRHSYPPKKTNPDGTSRDKPNLPK
jgi:phosphate transport system protein